ncbi:hypothetical protein [Microbulbifer sp. 2201CG32-9]|uniref:hypothetical protein n=1 Tax=unclassified Microbulbifer TaxID=2619833 RepID=UPI00345BBE98
MPSFSPLDTVPGLESWQFAYVIDDGHSAGTILRASVTQTNEMANSESPATAVLKCTIAVIDDQNNVQADAAGDQMDRIYVTTKTLQTDGGEIQVANEVSDLVSSCIVDVCNRLAVHQSIATMGIPGA